MMMMMMLIEPEKRELVAHEVEVGRAEPECANLRDDAATAAAAAEQSWPASTGTQHSKELEKWPRVWPSWDCFSDKLDIINVWIKYYPIWRYNDNNNNNNSFYYFDRTVFQIILAFIQGNRNINRDLNEAHSDHSPTGRQQQQSAIQNDDTHHEANASNTFPRKYASLEAIHGRKESRGLNTVGLISVLLILVALNWPIRQDAVSCLGYVSGDSMLYDNYNLHNNHHARRSFQPSLNHNYPFWLLPTTNPMIQTNYDTALDGSSSSSVDSLYSDQNNPAQSSIAPAANGWSSIVSDSSSQQDSLDDHVKKILVPRVSGTPGNVQVRRYIADSLEANGYTVQLDEFTDGTPIGKVKFANIIAYSNPDACRQLVLACHYDSKMMDGFLGAVDSAVPCAMLLKMSETFKSAFRAKAGSPDEDSLGLQFIFFDGEEAYKSWGPTDSLYGSRHLAEKWDRQKPPAQCSGRSELSRIELLVLLDLIGSKDTSFVRYATIEPGLNRKLQAHYNNFRKYEKEHLTGTMGLTSVQANRETAFKNRQLPLHMVEDDHVPFMRRGVPILSLLAHPFPSVWHTVNDNYAAIDFPKTRRILHVLENWLANYEKSSSS